MDGTSSRGRYLRRSDAGTRPPAHLTLRDDPGRVFLDERRAPVTTATKLFRNRELFQAMTAVVLPQFLQRERQETLFLWSTGCSSGEEVYSMAMIALDALERAGRPARLAAFGTDINRPRLRQAQAGVYLRPAREATAWKYRHLLEKYALLRGHEIRMGAAVRDVCAFKAFDIRQRPKRHTFHFIVCNHVLQYYDVPGQRHIVANCRAVLRAGGFLYLEGITDSGLEGSCLVRVPGYTNLYRTDPDASRSPK